MTVLPRGLEELELRLESYEERPVTFYEYLDDTISFLHSYPPDIFPGESNDPGPRFVASIREAFQEFLNDMHVKEMQNEEDSDGSADDSLAGIGSTGERMG